MKIVVCLNFISFVPDENKQFQIYEKKMDSFLNNENRAIIEQALYLKRNMNDRVVIMASGTLSGRLLLREALAIGCDEAHLIVQNASCSKKRYLIAEQMAELLKRTGFDVILTGYRMQDGHNAFLGSEIAEFLGINQISYVKKIQLSSDSIQVETEYESNFCISSPFPCMVTLQNQKAENRQLSVMDIMRSSQKPMRIWSEGQLSDVQNNESIKDLTIEKSEKLSLRKPCEMHEKMNPKQAAAFIIKKMEEQGLVKT